MKIVQWPVARPVPYDKNPRVISAEAVAKVAASIERFGFRQPIVVDPKDVIIIGHARLLAAQQLGLKKVPVHVADMPVADVKALRLADNRTGDESEWDDDLLPAELRGLLADGFDLALTGFDVPELDGWLDSGRGAGGGDAEVAPEPPGEPVIALGEVWACGDHRIACGDATSGKDVARLLAGAAPHLMVTDPPYGVGYDPDWRNRAERATPGSRMGGTPSNPLGAKAIGEVVNDDRADWREAWNLFPGDVAYVWHGGLMVGIVQASIEAANFVLKSLIIWRKQHFAISRGNYHWQHEGCFYAVRRGGKAHWHGGRKRSTVWNIANTVAFGGKEDDAKTNLSAQKPIECMRRPIENSSQPGNFVYDPFLGAGTTMIAAEMMDRRCLGMEIEPVWAEVSIRRWESYTGGTAKRVGDDATLSDLEAKQ